MVGYLVHRILQTSKIPRRKSEVVGQLALTLRLRISMIKGEVSWNAELFSASKSLGDCVQMVGPSVVTLGQTCVTGQVSKDAELFKLVDSQETVFKLVVCSHIGNL